MSNVTRFPLSRSITKLAVGFSTATVVGTLIGNIKPNNNFSTKIVYGLAAFGLGGAAVMATDSYTDKFFDEISELMDELDLD